jgi:hypothetical protein
MEMREDTRAEAHVMRMMTEIPREEVARWLLQSLLTFTKALRNTGGGPSGKVVTLMIHRLSSLLALLFLAKVMTILPARLVRRKRKVAYLACSAASQATVHQRTRSLKMKVMAKRNTEDIIGEGARNVMTENQGVLVSQDIAVATGTTMALSMTMMTPVPRPPNLGGNTGIATEMAVRKIAVLGLSWTNLMTPNRKVPSPGGGTDTDTEREVTKTVVLGQPMMTLMTLAPRLLSRDESIRVNTEIGTEEMILGRQTERYNIHDLWK